MIASHKIVLLALLAIGSHTVHAHVDDAKADSSVWQVNLRPMKVDPEVELNRARNYHDLASTGIILAESFSEARGVDGARCASYAHLFGQFNGGADRWSQWELENLALVTEREHGLYQRKYEQTKPLAHHNMMSAISQIELNYLDQPAENEPKIRGDPIECWYDLIDCLKRDADGLDSSSRSGKSGDQSDNENSANGEANGTDGNGRSGAFGSNINKLLEFLSDPKRAERISEYESEMNTKTTTNNDANDDVDMSNNDNNANHNDEDDIELGPSLPLDLVLEMIEHWESGAGESQAEENVHRQVSPESVAGETQSVDLFKLVQRFELGAHDEKEREARRAHLYKLGLESYRQQESLDAQYEAEREAQRAAENQARIDADRRANAEQQAQVAEFEASKLRERLERAQRQRDAEQARAEAEAEAKKERAARMRAVAARRRVLHLERVRRVRQEAERERDLAEGRSPAVATMYQLVNQEATSNNPVTVTRQQKELSELERKVRDTILFLAHRFQRFDQKAKLHEAPVAARISIDLLRDWQWAWLQIEQWHQNGVQVSRTIELLPLQPINVAINRRVQSSIRNIEQAAIHLAFCNNVHKQKVKSLEELLSKSNLSHRLIVNIDRAVDTRQLERQLAKCELQTKEWRTMADLIDNDAHWFTG